MYLQDSYLQIYINFEKMVLWLCASPCASVRLCAASVCGLSGLSGSAASVAVWLCGLCALPVWPRGPCACCVCVPLSASVRPRCGLSGLFGSAASVAVWLCGLCAPCVAAWPVCLLCASVPGCLCLRGLSRRTLGSAASVCRLNSVAILAQGGTKRAGGGTLW
jgi:hypothetical protein